MLNRCIQNILPLVEKPSRYLGSEINVIKKDPNRVKLKMVLAFPDLYDIGTSHFGMQILYHLLNRHPDIVAERVFAPGIDLAARLKNSGVPLFSLESKEPLNRFDIIGFSLLYELNYTNILSILDLAAIPFLGVDRDNSHPLIIAGGPCMCNPEPVADFFDAIVVGDGETVIMELAKAWIQWREDTTRDRVSLLRRWSQIEGIYIPSFFEPRINDCGFQTLNARYADVSRVKRAILADLDKVPFSENPIIPFGNPVHDRLRLEVSRGCTRGCRFCQAGMIYRPVRERSPEKLAALCEKSIAASGYEDISLLSLSTGDYGCIVPLMEGLMSRFASENIAVSLPSLRADTLTPKLMSLVKRVRKTGFTIAPEAGSQRLRDVINKDLTEKEIVDTVQEAFSLGWQVIKLYFMIGLPTETDEDLHALGNLVRTLHKLKGSNGRRGKLNVSVATFIPKPHTPFQWCSQITLEESLLRLRLVRDRIQLPGIQFKWQNPEVSRLEGLYARGDRRLSRLLITAYRKGCQFDGWSDKFQYRLWEDAFAAEGIDPDFFTTRLRNFSEPLPWDHIDTRIDKAFLIQEWKRALQGELTADCRRHVCNQCGVCDFDQIELKTHPLHANLAFNFCGSSHAKPSNYKMVDITYSKQGQAAYFGHLELINILLRALRRAKIPVKFTEGFHPKLKVSFDDPLPVGIESLEEHLTLTVPDDIQPGTICLDLNMHLPEGLRVHDCQPARRNSSRVPPKTHTYQVCLQEPSFDPEKLNAYFRRSDITIARLNRKGKLQNLDLKDMVNDIRLLDLKTLQMTLASESGKTVRPREVLRYIFDLTEDQIKQAKILKLRSAAGFVAKNQGGASTYV
jgi:radical SAM family uncharacterized protein/radical SAM-linked protein